MGFAGIATLGAPPLPDTEHTSLRAHFVTPLTQLTRISQTAFNKRSGSGGQYSSPCAYSNRDPLHFIERDLVARAVVELRGPRRFVCRDCLSIFHRAAILKVSRDAGCPKRVATGGGGESGSLRPALHHPEHVRARQGIRRQLPMLVDAPKERRFLFAPDAGRVEIRVEVSFRVVVCRNLMPLAAFFM